MQIRPVRKPETIGFHSIGSGFGNSKLTESVRRGFPRRHTSTKRKRQGIRWPERFQNNEFPTFPLRSRERRFRGNRGRTANQNTQGKPVFRNPTGSLNRPKNSPGRNQTCIVRALPTSTTFPKPTAKSRWTTRSELTFPVRFRNKCRLRRRVRMERTQKRTMPFRFLWKGFRKNKRLRPTRFRDRRFA